ncbi:MAG: sulfur carrier protein ThiS [Pseudomonadota bacterium]
MSTPDFISESFTVVVNGQPQTTTARTLQDWVDAQSVQPAALATAVNGEFVPRDLRALSTHPGRLNPCPSNRKTRW